MNRALIKKYIYDSLIILIPCALGIVSFCWFRTWIVGELDTRQFKQIIDLLPNDWRKFATVDFDWLVSYLGRTSLTLDEPMLLLFVCAWPIIRGSDVVSGELSRGTMEMLLGQPVSRSRVYWTHARMTVLGLLVLCGLTWFGMALGIWTTSVEESSYPEIRIPIIDYRIPITFAEPVTKTIAMVTEVNPLQFYPGIINLFCMSFFIAGFAAWCSSWDRYRWRTLGIVAGVYMVSGMMKILAMSSERLKWVEYLTFFGFYEPASSIELSQNSPGAQWYLLEYNIEGAIVGMGPMGNWLILLGFGVLFYFWGARIFRDRDLPAPI